MILILVRFMQIGRARESWQIHKARYRFMVNSALWICQLSRARPIYMNRTKIRILTYIYILSE